MASLSQKLFLGAPNSDESSRFGSVLPSDLRNLHSSTLQISTRQFRYRKFGIQAVGSTYGTYFRVKTHDISHGGGVGIVIDGCPARLPLSEKDMQVDLDRSKPGQSQITTPRKETDTCSIRSGVFDGLTTGTSIMVKVPNTDQRGNDYTEMPPHADATYDFEHRGGGRSSTSETIGRVAAGAVAKKILKLYSRTEVLAYVSKVHKVVLPEDLIDHESLTLDQIHSNIIRCPNPEYAQKMIDAIQVRGDWVGGSVTCIVRNLPRGLGTPVSVVLEAELAKAALSLPATKGFEIGSGFLAKGPSPAGSCKHHSKRSLLGTFSTWSGISSGEIVTMRVPFLPTFTIGRKQNTVTRDKHEIEPIAPCCHDPFIVTQAVPMVESMVALVLVDQLMTHFAQNYLFPPNS